MRIGIDATALPLQLFGAGNYIVNLTQALLRLDKANEYVVFAKPDHAVLFAGLNAQLVSVPLVNRIHRIIWEQSWLPVLTRTHRLDVLHSPHYTMPLLKACPTLVTCHDMSFYLYPQTHLLYKKVFFRAMIPLAARRADALIAISESTRQDLLRLIKPPCPVFTVSYGIAPYFQPAPEAEKLQARRKFDLPEKFILYVGNLEPRKNLPNLLRAFAGLIQQGLPHDLVLAGSRGWKDNEIFTLINELALVGRVKFPGYIPQTELPAVYSLADTFAYPSLYEGFGLPVLEAMACGTPVITSNISSMPEVMGGAGILIDPNSVDELAKALFRVLTDQSLRATLATAGLARAKLFSWERAAIETLAVYTRIAQTQ
jgi:glycosyltransferase involved in cell wall biosynthesis